MSNFKFFFILCGLFLFQLFPAQAMEIINRFDADINVNPDGSLTITETINLNHEGKKIKRGIYRDLSTKKGEKYAILEVKRNGEDEPWFTEFKPGLLRLNTGNNDNLPAPAVSEYEITYVMYNALRRIKEENLNELYLNITGKWAFPIAKVTVSVHYPAGTQIIRQYSYQTGDRTRSYTPSEEMIFRNLAPNQEITIAQAFTPSTVNIPLPLPDRRLILAFGATLIYFLIMWYLYGKDPSARAVVPNWEPPKGLSPLECAYIDNNGKEPQNAFFLHILWIISRHVVTVQTTKEKRLFGTQTSYELITDKTADKTDHESHLYLTSYPHYLRLDGEADEHTAAYNLMLQKTVQKKLEGVVYRTRGWITFFGALILPLTCIYTLHINIDGLLCLTNFFFVLYAMGVSLWGRLPKLVQILGGLFCLPLIIFTFKDWFTPAEMALLIGDGVMVYIFRYLLFQPTLIGQRQKEKIEGLKMFLKAITGNNISAAFQTDKNGLNMQKRLTPEDMDALFPYAVALNLEKEWTQKYTHIFGAAAYETTLKNHPCCNDMFWHSISSNCSSSIAVSGGRSGIGSRGGGFAGGGFGGGGGGGR